MQPEEIASAYEVVAADLQNRAAAEAAKIGNSQRALGLLAGRVATPTGMTSNLANYTYNRTLRPTINTLTTSLVTEGKANALSEALRGALSKAKQNYQSASSAAATTPTTTTNPYSELFHNTKEVTEAPKTPEEIQKEAEDAAKAQEWKANMTGLQAMLNPISLAGGIPMQLLTFLLGRGLAGGK